MTRSRFAWILLVGLIGGGLCPLSADAILRTTGDGQGDGATLWSQLVEQVRPKSTPPCTETTNTVRFQFHHPKQQAELRAVDPKAVRGIRLANHNNVPLKIVMACIPKTLDEVQEMLSVVQQVDREDNPAPGEQLKLHLVCDLEATLHKLKLTQAEMDAYVEVDRYFSVHNQDVWMQDWGEIAAVDIAGEKKEHLVVFDTNRGRADLAELPGCLARLWSGFYLKKQGPSPGSGDYGGNIEATPDDVLMIGNTSSEELRKMLSDGGYEDRMAVLKTDWLQVGHVDEFITTIPNPNAPRGYTVVYADPRMGLELVRGLSKEALASEGKGLVEAVYRDARIHPEGVLLSLEEGGAAGLFAAVHMLHGHQHGYPVDISKIAPMVARGRSADAPALVAANEEIAGIIDANVATLCAAIKKASGDDATPVDVVALPALFQPFDYAHHSIALVPGVANMVVLRKHVAVPDPLLPTFRREIDSRLRKLGVTPAFIPDGSYHFSQGQLHCGTNVMRHPNHYLYRPLRSTRARRLPEAASGATAAVASPAAILTGGVTGGMTGATPGGTAGGMPGGAPTGAPGTVPAPAAGR